MDPRKNNLKRGKKRGEQQECVERRRRRGEVVNG